MTHRIARCLLVASLGAAPVALVAQTTTAPIHPAATTAVAPRAAAWPERAIRHDIPLTNMIQRAFAAGTRDSSGRPGKNYWQNFVEYTIDARLDSVTHRITGRETIVLHNNSPDTLATIALRLDQNVFAPSVTRNRAITGETDGMKLTHLTVDGENVSLEPGRGGGGGGGGRGRGGRGGADTTGPRLTTISGTTTTEAMIRLAHALPPGTTATLEAEWNFEVPAPGARGLRMGRWGDSLYEVAQWYPQIAVYDDLRGWDTDLYQGDVEFYNNFGHYDVHLDVPGGWLVGATGVLQNPAEVLTPTARERLSHVLESDSQRTIVGADERGPGKATMPGTRLIWHFVTDTVGDFAWGTSSQYVFDATRALIPGKGYIPYYLMYLVGHQGTYRNQGATGRHALLFYSKLWMPYTWNEETQVDGPENGMEYPTFIMASGSTDHETGHQWWPMMVGTNETWYGFMDEGFNNYMNILSNADNPSRGGRGGGGGGGRGRAACTEYATLAPPGGTALVNCLGQNFGAASGDERHAPLMWDNNYAGPQSSFQAYSEAGMMLSMLGGVVGDSAVWSAMSVYAKAWRFKHPTPWDYAFILSNALHRDLGWFWYYWLFTTESVDGSIAKVTTVGPRTAVTVHEAGQMPSPVTLAVQFAAKGPAIHQMVNSRMIDSNTALVTYPVDVWWNGSRTFVAHLDFGGRKIEKITFDPYGRFPDHNVSDNVWPRDSTAAPAAGRGGRRGRGGE